MASSRQQTFLSWFPYWNNPTPAPKRSPVRPSPPTQQKQQSPSSAQAQSTAAKRSPSPPSPTTQQKLQSTAAKRSPSPSPTTQQKLQSPSSTQAQSTAAKRRASSSSPSPSSSPLPSPSPSPSKKSGQSQSLPQATQQQSPPLQSPRTSSSQFLKQFSIESPKQSSSPKTSRSQSPSQPQPQVAMEISGSTMQLAPQTQSEHLQTQQSLPSQSRPFSEPEATKDEHTKPTTNPPQPMMHTEKKTTMQDVEQPIITIMQQQPTVGSSSKNHDDGQSPQISEESTSEIASVPEKFVDASNIILDEEAHTTQQPLSDEKSKQVIKEDLKTVPEAREADRQEESNTIEGHKEEQQHEKPPTVLNEESNSRKEDLTTTIPQVGEADRQEESNTIEGHKEEQQHEKPPTVLNEYSNSRKERNIMSVAEPKPKTTGLGQQINEPLMEVESSITRRRMNGSQGCEENMIGQTSSDRGQQSSFRKDIKEGENKGASMYVGHETLNNQGPIPVKKGHTLAQNKNNGRSEEKKVNSDERSDQAASDDEAITINSNVQNINNSLLHDSSCSQKDPGVHIIFSGKSYKPTSTEDGIETIETSKSVFVVSPAKKLMYEPIISNNHIARSYHDSFDNNDQNPQEPKCYGCQFNGNGKALDY